MSKYHCWGRYPAAEHEPLALQWRNEIPDLDEDTTYLPHGQGRSYGDVCLNDGGKILTTEDLNKFIAFDSESGVVRCEGGVTLAELVNVTLPRGWFLPVSPGTKFVSVGGAIANDIHGKNHHCEGTFGRHVDQFELLRSDGSRTICSPTENAELFAATIGGLGLTGLILWADVRLKSIKTGFIDSEIVPFYSLDEFFQLSSDSDQSYEYTVAWLDCITKGEGFGRGIFFRGNHSTKEKDEVPAPPRKLPLIVPFDFPGFVLNRYTIRAFNEVYFRAQRRKAGTNLEYYDPFFYPLDSILHWNRIYGSKGFQQFQCVVPKDNDNAAIREVFRTVVDSGQASFLAVLKEFGSIDSPGLLSFPREGATLCLDFANRGKKTIDLLMNLDKQVREAGGALYPAKDACMPPESFKCYYPEWEKLKEFVDPKFSSSFWRRVT